MRVGELASRTGVSTRRLRYYEEKGLIRPDRDANGYRDYPAGIAAQVVRIRDLLAAGLPIELVQQVLPLLSDSIYVDDPPDGLIGAIDEHRRQLDARISCLSRNRDALVDYAETLRRRSRQ